MSSESAIFSRNGLLLRRDVYTSAPEYSGGDNIDITNNVISGRDWTSEISAASANAYNSAVNQIPDVSEFLTQVSADYLYYPLQTNPSGYLTSHQDLSEYAKTDDLSAYQEKGNYYSASNPSGFITGVDLSDYYKKNETSSKEEISAAIEGFEILTPEQLSAINTISSREFISAISADVSAYTPWISGWKTIGAVTANWGDTFQVISSHDFSGFHNHSIGLKGSNITLPTTAAIGQALDNKVDTSAFTSYTAGAYNYISAVNVVANNAYTTAINNYHNKADKSAISSYSSDLSYLSGACDYLSGAVEEKLDASAFDPDAFYPSSNPSGFITGVDLSNYYEKNETSSKEEIADALTAIDNTISGLTGEFQEKGDYYSASNPSGFITGVDLTDYYKKNETSSKEEISAAFEDLSGIDDPYELSAGDGISIVNNNTTKKTIISSTGISSKLDTSSFTAYTATAVQGIEYTGIAPIDVNNTTHEISADVWTLSGTSGISILEDSENKVTTIAYTATATADLSNYYTKTDTSSKEEISAALTGKQDNLTFAYNASDAISSINGSALAGGTAVAFPITGEYDSTAYSANCDASSYNIKSDYCTTIFGAYELRHAHSPSTNGSATYDNIINVANTYITAIPAQVVANSGLATGTNILYIVTGN